MITNLTNIHILFVRLPVIAVIRHLTGDPRWPVRHKPEYKLIQMKSVETAILSIYILLQTLIAIYLYLPSIYSPHCNVLPLSFSTLLDMVASVANEHHFYSLIIVRIIFNCSIISFYLLLLLLMFSVAVLNPTLLFLSIFSFSLSFFLSTVCDNKASLLMMFILT